MLLSSSEGSKRLSTASVTGVFPVAMSFQSSARLLSRSSRRQASRLSLVTVPRTSRAAVRRPAGESGLPDQRHRLVLRDAWDCSLRANMDVGVVPVCPLYLPADGHRVLDE